MVEEIDIGLVTFKDSIADIHIYIGHLERNLCWREKYWGCKTGSLVHLDRIQYSANDNLIIFQCLWEATILNVIDWTIEIADVRKTVHDSILFMKGRFIYISQWILIELQIYWNLSKMDWRWKIFYDLNNKQQTELLRKNKWNFQQNL